MYIIYNQDGSIKESNINEYIQQGNNLVNEFAIQIEGYNINEYVLSATFTLPNGDKTTIVSDETTESDEYPYPARKLALTNDETALAGTLKMNIQAIFGSTILTSHTVYLQVNDGTSENSAVLITQQQYENLIGYYMNNLNEKADKCIPQTAGNLAGLDASGNLMDYGFAISFEDFVIE